MNDMTPITAATAPAPGIYAGIENDAYHAGPGISKSGLWTIYTQSPAHYKFGERKETAAFDFGTACHFAILQPELFEPRVMRGPADRRGNNWKDAQAEAANSGRLLLTAPDYDAVLVIRDAVHADAFLNALIVSPHSQIEHSAYAIDPETGVLRRCRPDLYRPDLGIMVDVKSTLSAHPEAFARSVINYGYHAQEAWYTDVWNDALGAVREADQYIKAESDDDVNREIKGTAAGGVQGFVFLAWEKKTPFVTARYELPPSIVEDGRAICRKALARYAECTAANEWPGYSGEITELQFKRWSYQEIDAPAEEAA